MNESESHEMLDINDIEASSREYELRHPVTDSGMGLFIHLLPSDDPKVKSVERKQANRQLAKRKKNLNYDQIQAKNDELLLASFDGWRWGEDVTYKLFGEIKPDYSQEIAKKLIKKDWVRNQLIIEIGDESGFFQN